MALVTIGLTALVSCVGLEIALRVLGEDESRRNIRFEHWRYMQPDAELSFVPRPNTRVEYARYEASFMTNSVGLRGPERSIEARPGVRRIVVLGDSMAWGHGVGEGATFAEVLERRLPDTEVINLGVPGFNVRTELQYFRRVGEQYRPDVVLLALCQNDVIDHETVERQRAQALCSDDATHAATTAAADAGVFRSVKQFLADHSRLYRRCQDAVSAWKPLAKLAVRIGLKEELGGFEMLDDNLHVSLAAYPPVVERAVQQLLDDLREVDGYVRSRGARLLIVPIPALQAVESDQLVRSLAYTRYEPDQFDMEKPGRLLAAFAASQGVRFVDLLPLFRTECGEGERLYLPGDLHLNAAGHRVFADAVEPVVREMLIEASRESLAGLMSDGNE